MPAAPPIVRTVADLRRTVAAWRDEKHSIGFVPTMGALHEGHLSLVRLLKRRYARVAASIFVNPKQFAAHEDLGAYPRDEAGDLAKLAAAGCDVVFAPDPEEMYPEGFASAVSVAGVSAPLEGEARPAFFGGVATVVTKLLLQCLPDGAAFGEKDYQQLLVVRRLARDLDIPVEIIAGETVREADGLAMSSRNAYLSAAERGIAAQLSAVLRDAIERLHRGEPIAAVERDCTARLQAAGFGPIDYVAVRDAETLAPLARLDRPARILAAAWLGRTRLIDNFAAGGVVL
ncbi:MAG: pantoate--beta-alanine ligase [Hyphomonadaceae bacterium]